MCVLSAYWISGHAPKCDGTHLKSSKCKQIQEKTKKIKKNSENYGITYKIQNAHVLYSSDNFLWVHVIYNLV